jgi:anti-sigma factor RsiW
MTGWDWLSGKLREWFLKAEARFCHAGQPPGMLHCREVIDLIMGYVEGTLDPHERRSFEAHIADCRNCWRFLRGYRETVALGRHLQEEEIPSNVRERLETFLRHRLQRPS